MNSFNSRGEWNDFVWDQIANRLALTKSPLEIKRILEQILGDYEKNLLIKRVIAIALIQEGLSYSEIGKLLWLSPSTISSIKKNLAAQNAGYKSWRKFRHEPKQYSSKIKISGEMKNQPLWEIIKEIVAEARFQSWYGRQRN